MPGSTFSDRAISSFSLKWLLPRLQLVQRVLHPGEPWMQARMSRLSGRVVTRTTDPPRNSCKSSFSNSVNLRSQASGAVAQLVASAGACANLADVPLRQQRRCPRKGGAIAVYLRTVYP